MNTATLHNPLQIDLDRPGKHHYKAAFPLDGSWGYSLVPITVINGLRGGDSTAGVAVFGGTHGNEYEGQIAVKRLCHDLDPAQMSGRLILMPQLSETACRAGLRISPEDGVNMNRAFPGNPRGTISYRISHFVKTCIFPRVRIVIDLHSGGTEAAFPLCASLHPIPNATQFEETVHAATLFDTPFIFVYSRQMASGLLTDEAEDEGKIAVGGEFGYGGGVSPIGVQHAYEGVRNVLKYYELLAGAPIKIDQNRSSSPRLVQAPELRDYIPSPCDSIWEPLVTPGQDVHDGQLIGRLHDFSDHDSDPLDIRAHRTGVVIALQFGAACRKGLTLFVIAEDFPHSL
jgi:predicted deacylase